MGSPDHPRSRGVYGGPAPSPLNDGGSSPLARGLRGTAAGHHCPVGIIPARAGFTCAPCASAISMTDHPRSRGVYASLLLGQIGERGSSPLARGLQHVGRAAAGGLVDHPRSRGVYTVSPMRIATRPGSSPLARGLRMSSVLRRRRARIIPARAGFTRDTWCAGTGGSDHPRSRGVYKSQFNPFSESGGSSPLARGLQNEH